MSRGNAGEAIAMMREALDNDDVAAAADWALIYLAEHVAARNGPAARRAREAYEAKHGSDVG